MLFDEGDIERQHRALLDTSPGSDLLGASGIAVDLIRKINLSLSTASTDVVVVSTLGARLTNSIGATFKLMGAGYFGPAIHQLRDIADTAILLEFFHRHPESIDSWMKLEGMSRLDKFKTGNLVNRLKTQHGIETKWEIRFRRYSELGTHPSTMGVLSIHSETGLHLNPYFDKGKFSELLWEISIDSCDAAETFVRALNSVSEIDLLAQFSGDFHLLDTTRARIVMLQG